MWNVFGEFIIEYFYRAFSIECYIFKVFYVNSYFLYEDGTSLYMVNI